MLHRSLVDILIALLNIVWFSRRLHVYVAARISLYIDPYNIIIGNFLGFSSAAEITTVANNFEFPLSIVELHFSGLTDAASNTEERDRAHEDVLSAIGCKLDVDNGLNIGRHL